MMRFPAASFIDAVKCMGGALAYHCPFAASKVKTCMYQKSKSSCIHLYLFFIYYLFYTVEGLNPGVISKVG